MTLSDDAKKHKTQWLLKSKIGVKMPAPNERFGTTAAVTPQNVTCEHERKQPAERAVSAAASPSRRHVGCNVRETVHKEQIGGLKLVTRR